MCQPLFWELQVHHFISLSQQLYEDGAMTISMLKTENDKA